MITLQRSNSYNMSQICFETDEERFYIEEMRNKHRQVNPAARHSNYSNEFLYFCTPTYRVRNGLSQWAYDEISKYTDNIQISDDLLKMLNPITTEITHNVPNEEFKLRDYQKDATESLLKHGTGLVCLATSGGKSLIITTVFHNLIEQNIVKTDQICVLLVPTCALVIQMYKDMEEYGMDMSQIQQFSSKFNVLKSGQKIVISNRDWLKRHWSDVEEKYELGCLFVDEVHTISGGGLGNACGKWIEKLDVKIKYGCTGTLSNNSMQAEWFIQGIIGPVRYTKSVKSLQDDGWTAQTNVVHILLQHKNIPSFPRDTYEEICAAHRYEEEWIIENEVVNKLTCKILEKLKGNTICLFARIAHGETILEGLNYKNKHLVAGKIDVEVRDSVREIAENSNDCIILGNRQCISTGINIKNIQNIVFIGGGKSFISVVQSIGRGLRLMKGKTSVNIIDISHNLKYSEDHYKARLKIYREEYEKEPKKKVFFL